MAMRAKPPAEVDNCRSLLPGAVKNLADRLYGPQGPAWASPGAAWRPWRLPWARPSRTNSSPPCWRARPPPFTPPPRPTPARVPLAAAPPPPPRDPQPRQLRWAAGAAAWSEPQRYCGTCRKAFFPQSRALGIDQGGYSCSALDLICYAGANEPSFREASLDLDKRAALAVSEKQVERLCERLGGERLAERDAQARAFEALPLAQREEGAPAGVLPPGPGRGAVVMADAGMLQLRGGAAGDGTAAGAAAGAGAAAPRAAGPTGPPVPGRDPASGETAPEDDADDPDDGAASGHWREGKVGLVLRMQSPAGAADPCPPIPPTFLSAERVGQVVRGLRTSAAPVVQGPGEPGAAAGPEAVAPAEDYEGPQLQERRVVASRRSWPLLGATLATAAWAAGLARAERKAFVADGARSTWKGWRRWFSSYVPVLDFIHALSYVYQAAKAVGGDAVRGWELYRGWIAWVWQGQVQGVLARLQQWQEANGEAEPGDGETSARRVVSEALRSLRNNQGKMQYDAYRRQGLPIVSGLVESMAKQISRRVKGTEKFWGEEGAGAILQLRADYLSDGEVMERFWERRQAAATGQRVYRPRAQPLLV
jgi:hypothetical protein